MKLTAILLLAVCLSASAGTRAQTVSLNLQDVPFEKVFKEIRKQTGFNFLFSSEELNKAGKVTVKVSNATISQTLTECLKNKPFTFIIENKTIVVQKSNAPVVNSGLQELPAPPPPISILVTDLEGKPLQGASVSVNKKVVGITNDNGFLSIDLKQDDLIEVSFVGFESQSLKIKSGLTSLAFKLVPVKSELDEVVTGYARLRRESFTGNSIKLSQDDIVKVGPRNMIQVLQVFDPSFRIETNNLMGSDPNTVPEFYVRGRSGIGTKELDQVDVSSAALVNNPNLPIFIMDGYEVDAKRVYDFDITRIKSVNILKDAAATAVYGSRAANGVVVIETIAPEAGKLKVNYNVVNSYIAPDLSGYNLMNGAEKLEAERLLGYYNPVSGNPTSIQTMALMNEYQKKLGLVAAGNTNWIEIPVRTGFNQKHSLSIDGGSEAIRFNIGLRRDDENGVMKGSGRVRTGANLTLDYRSDKIQIRNDISYDQVGSTNSPYGSFEKYATKSQYYNTKDLNGNLLKVNDWLHTSGVPAGEDANPAYDALMGLNFNKNKYTSLINNLSIIWKPFSGMQIRGQLSINKTDGSGEVFTDPASSKYVQRANSDFSTFGSLAISGSNNLLVNTNLLANYTKKIGNSYLNVAGGMNTREMKANSNYVEYQGFVNGYQVGPNYALKIASPYRIADNHTRLFGSFLSANYSFKDKYLLDFSGRLDGSSEFGVNQRVAPFYAIGTGLNLHKFDFIRQFSFISKARVTGTFGQLGKTNFPPYAAQDYYTMQTSIYRGSFGALLNYMGNDALTWEKTNAYDLIFDLGFLKNRINLNVNLYSKITNDLVNDIDLPLSAGFTSFKGNVGKISNKGLEVQVRVEAIKTKDLYVAVYGNFATNKNKLLEISESLRNYNKLVDARLSPPNINPTPVADRKKLTRPYTKYVVGGSTTAIFGMKSLGINPADGKEIFLKSDGTITYDWTAAEQVIIGDITPKGQGAFGFNASYKGFTLFTSLLYEFGAKIYNTTLVEKVESVDVYHFNADRRVLSQRWISPGDVTPLRALSDRGRVTRPTSRFIQTNNFLNINSVSLGYQIPDAIVKKYNISLLRVQLSTNDFAYLSRIQRERGIAYPYARTYNFTITLGL